MQNRSRLEGVLAIAGVWAVGCITAATSDPASPEQVRLAEQRVERVELPPPPPSRDTRAAIEERVRFAAGSSELDDRSIATLARLCEQLRAGSGDFRIELYDRDAAARDARARRLAEARAEAIRRSLRRAGVLAENTAVFVGRPLEPDGTTDTGRRAVGKGEVLIVATALVENERPDPR